MASIQVTLQHSGPMSSTLCCILEPYITRKATASCYTGVMASYKLPFLSQLIIATLLGDALPVTNTSKMLIDTYQRCFSNSYLGFMCPTTGIMNEDFCCTDTYNKVNLVEWFVVIFLFLAWGEHMFYVCSCSPRSHGLVVRAVSCEVRGPGFDSSSGQMFFFTPRVLGGRN